MNQRKYILRAVLILAFATVGYLFVKKLNVKPADTLEQDRTVAGNIVEPVNDEILEQGKKAFQEKCVACHPVHKADGDRLTSVFQKGFWDSNEKIAQYLRKPEMFTEEEYIKKLMRVFDLKKPHIQFPTISDEEVKAIFQYVMESTRH